MDNAIDYASKASALAVTKFGAQAGMPTKKEEKSFTQKIIEKCNTTSHLI
ncbi:hypothetical protein [Oceanobacillus salinisoli]|nr:hypothetical protein [Oceanobacillus salinisoli]